MNHVRIAEQALAYRTATVADSFSRGGFNPVALAGLAVECADPTVDTAIRRLGTAWIRQGLPPEAITEPWAGADVDAMFSKDPSLLDSIDDIIRSAHRVRFSRPRRSTTSVSSAHRPNAYARG